jgi:hypothetical protein
MIARKINQEAACPEFECVDKVRCTIEGGDISSFDSWISNVDLCGHLIAQQQGIWKVSGRYLNTYSLNFYLHFI